MKKKLKDICTLEKGKQIDTKLLDDSNSFRYINGGIKESGFFNDYNTEGETVLISEGGASCGYVNYVNEKFWCGCHCYRLTNISIYPKYLFYSLKGSQQGIMDLRTGAAMPNIKKETLKDFEITVCDSLPEQQKIAAHLDTIQSAIDNKKQQLSELDELVKSKFVEMFGETPVESGKWKVENVGNLSKEVKYGTSSPAVENGKYKYLRMNNLTTAGYLDLTDLKYIDISPEEYEKCVVRKGDIIFNRTNSREHVGKTCLFDLDEEMIIAGYLIRVRLVDELNGRFFSEYMNTPYMKLILRKTARGAVNQSNINSQELQKLQIPVPPIELQNTFADYVQKIDSAKSIVKTQLNDLNELLESKMDFYFGE